MIYSMLAGAADRYESGWLLSDSLSEYLDEMSPVEPVIEERIDEIPDETETDT